MREYNDQATYQIKVRGRLDSHWAITFPEMEFTFEDHHTTVMTGQFPDSAALYGLIIKLRDFNISLVSITRLD